MIVMDIEYMFPMMIMFIFGGPDAPKWITQPNPNRTRFGFLAPILARSLYVTICACARAAASPAAATLILPSREQSAKSFRQNTELASFLQIKSLISSKFYLDGRKDEFQRMRDPAPRLPLSAGEFHAPCGPPCIPIPVQGIPKFQ